MTDNHGGFDLKPCFSNHLSEQLLESLITEIKQDLIISEQSPANLSGFSAILWFESPSRHYSQTFISICMMNPTSTNKYLMQQLYSLLSLFIEPGGATNIRAKLILIISQLLYISPTFKNSAELNEACNLILRLNITSSRRKNLGAAQPLIYDAIDNITSLAISAGAVLFGNNCADTVSDLFGYMENGPNMACSPPAFRCFLCFIVTFFTNGGYATNTEQKQLFLDQKNKFIDLLYKVISTFQMKDPIQYQVIVEQGVTNADSLIEIILKWKSTPDPEHLCVLGALLPLVKTTYNGTKNPKSIILHSLQDFKQKKEAARLSVAQGIFEIMFAVTIANSEQSFIDFIVNIQPKFDEWLFNPKQKLMNGRFLSEFMPRYAALDFARKGVKSPSAQLMLGQTDPSRISNLIKFLSFVFNHYPPTQTKTDLTSILFDVSQIFSNMMQKIISKKTESEENIQTLYNSVTTIVKFFCGQILNVESRDFSRFSLMTLHNCPIQHPFKMNLPMQQLRQANKSLTCLTGTISRALSIVAQMSVDDVSPYINFLRIFFTCDHSWEKQYHALYNQDVLIFVIELGEVFKNEIEKALLMASPSLSNLPYILLRFLIWVSCALKETKFSEYNQQQQQKRSMKDNFLESLSMSIIMLRGIADESLLNSCEQQLNKIYSVYCIIYEKYQIPFQEYDEVIIYAVKTVFQGWLGHIYKQLSSEKTIPQSELANFVRFTNDEIIFDTSRENIAVMTKFLCQHIHCLTGFPIHDSDVKCMQTYFFRISSIYLNWSNFQDDLFNNAYLHLNPISYGDFFVEMNEIVKEKSDSLKFDRPFFWLNMIDLYQNVIASNKLQVCHGLMIEAIIPSFLKLLFYGVFEDRMQIFLQIFCLFLGSFYTKEIAKNKLLWRTVIISLIELSLKYTRMPKNEMAVSLIIQNLPSLLEFFDLDISSNYQHVSNYSLNAHINKTVWFILNGFEKLINTVHEEHMAPSMQLCLNLLLMNNAAYVWPLYITYSQAAQPMFHSLLLESLNLLYHYDHKPTINPNLTIKEINNSSSNTTKRAESSTKSQDDKEKKSHHKLWGEKYIKKNLKNVINFPKANSTFRPKSISPPVNNTAASLTVGPQANNKPTNDNSINGNQNKENKENVDCRIRIKINPKIAAISSKLQAQLADINRSRMSIGNNIDFCKERFQMANFNRFELNKTLEYQPREHLFFLLTEDNFKVFRNPPSLNVGFIRAAISCSIAYAIHDQIFQLMMNELSQDINSLKNPKSPCNLFFTAWFLEMSEGWDVSFFMKHARTAVLTSFLRNLSPPFAFVYYLHLIYEKFNCKKEIIENVFIECFLRPILAFPLDYGYMIRLNLNDSDREKFIQLAIDHEMFQNLIRQIINNEPIYPMLKSNNFSVNYVIALKFLSPRPPIVDFVNFNEISYATKMIQQGILQEPSPTILQSLKSSNWIMKVGDTSKGYCAYLVFPEKMPDMKDKPKVLFYHFFSHFSYENTPVEIIVSISDLPQTSLLLFNDFLKLTPDDFVERIQQITLLNPSIKASRLLNILKVGKWGPKIRIPSNLQAELTQNDKVSLPLKCLCEFPCIRGSLECKYAGMQSQLMFTEDELILASQVQLFGKSITAYRKVPITNVAAIEDEGYDNILLDFGSSGSIKILLNNELSGKSEIVSKYLKYCRDSLIMAYKFSQKVECEILDMKVSPLHQEHMIAHSLFVLAKDATFVNIPAIQLFEAALSLTDIYSRKENQLNSNWGNDKDMMSLIDKIINNVTCDIGVVENLPVTLQFLFHEVFVRQNLLDRVVVALAGYVKAQNFKTIVNLLPLFIRFMNTSKDQCLLSEIGSALFGLSIESTDYFLPFERFFWPNITNEIALECVIPMMIWEVDNKRNEVRRLIQSFMHKNSKVIGRMISHAILDGTIRRRSFCQLITTSKIFSSIRKLPFNSPDFVIPNLSLLMFCSVVGSIRSDQQETLDDIAMFLESILRTIELVKPELNLELTRQRNKLIQLLSNKKIMSALDLMKTIDKLLETFDENIHKDYIKTITQTFDDDDPEIWYIKAAADSYLNCGNNGSIVNIILIMPNLIASYYYIQTIAFVFEAMSNMIMNLNHNLSLNNNSNCEKQEVPINLIWLPIFGASHSSQLLRKASLTLLQLLISYFTKNKIIDDISALKLPGNFINVWNSAFNVPSMKSFTFDVFSLNNNFPYFFVKMLMKCLEEVETRKQALQCLRVCIESLQNSPEKALYFVLPFISFDESDLSWIVKLLGKASVQSIPSLILQNLADENDLIFKYFVEMFGERHCSHKMDQVIDCLLLASDKIYISSANRFIISQKCWKMIDNEQQPSKYEKISMVMAKYATNDKIAITQNSLSKLDEDSLSICLQQFINLIFDEIEHANK